MNVRVLFFASLREAVGVESLAVALSKGTLVELRTKLSTQLGDPADALWAVNVRLACNQELLSAESYGSLLLVDGDELAFLPPVTGG